METGSSRNPRPFRSGETVARPRSRTRLADPGICGREQHAQATVDSPERDGLLVRPNGRGDLGRHVAGLQRPLLVPDPDRVRVVLVVRPGNELEAAARV